MSTSVTRWVRHRQHCLQINYNLLYNDINSYFNALLECTALPVETARYYESLIKHGLYHKYMEEFDKLNHLLFMMPPRFKQVQHSANSLMNLFHWYIILIVGIILFVYVKNVRMFCLCWYLKYTNIQCVVTYHWAIFNNT